MTSLSNYF